MDRAIGTAADMTLLVPQLELITQLKLPNAVGAIDL
jgi:hypothetical protein